MNYEDENVPLAYDEILFTSRCHTEYNGTLTPKHVHNWKVVGVPDSIPPSATNTQKGGPHFRRSRQ